MGAKAEIESFQDDEVILIEDEISVLGFVVFIFKEGHALIKTFNLSSYNNRKVIVPLFEKISSELRTHNIDKIKSQAHLTNRNSINLHLGLGFKETSRNDFFIEFETTKDEVMEIVNKRIGLLSR